MKALSRYGALALIGVGIAAGASSLLARNPQAATAASVVFTKCNIVGAAHPFLAPITITRMFNGPNFENKWTLELPMASSGLQISGDNAAYTALPAMNYQLALGSALPPNRVELKVTDVATNTVVATLSCDWSKTYAPEEYDSIKTLPIYWEPTTAPNGAKNLTRASIKLGKDAKLVEFFMKE